MIFNILIFTLVILSLILHTIELSYEAIITFQTEFTDDESFTILKTNQCTDERIENCKEWAILKDTDQLTDEYYDIVTVG